MADASRKSRLPAYILASAALGLAAGLLLGERTAVLQPLGIAYAKLLEVAVFPYLICSLLVGLGSLARERARRLLKASWGFYLVVWGIAFLTIFLLGFFIPPAAAPSLLLPPVEDAGSSLLDFLIPANIAVALDRNFVPAIVVFAVLYAVAVQATPQKASFLEVMEVLRKGSVTIWSWVVYLAPFGVFALFAATAGTVDAASARGLVIYTLLFLFGTFFLAFVVLPFLLSRLVPLRYGEVLAELRPALTLALVTTLSVAALPFIQRAAEALCRREKLESEEAADVVRASLSIAYVLSQLGNYFIALFLIYASYHQRLAIAFEEWIALPLMTLLSGIGSPSASVDAVAFLAAWLGLPANTTDLYVETMTITRYGQVALSVMGFAFVTLGATLVYFGRARLRWHPLATGFLLTLLVFGGLAVGGRLFSAQLFPPPSDSAIMARTLAPELTARAAATVHRARPKDLAPLEGAGTFEGILARGKLRVGYGHDIIPFSYFNAAGDLVGYDVAAAYRFAGDLHLALEFYPVDFNRLEEDLEAQRFDIVMAGAYATPARIRALAVSDFYLVNPLALIVPSEQASNFSTFEQIAARESLRIAVFRDPVLEPLLKSLFPQAEIRVLDSYDELPAVRDVDAAIWTRDQAAAWTSARSGYTAVVPRGLDAPLPFSYLMRQEATDLLRYVNLWIRLEEANGTRAAAYAYWVTGMARDPQTRRWNLLDDLLWPRFDR